MDGVLGWAVNHAEWTGPLMGLIAIGALATAEWLAKRQP